MLCRAILWGRPPACGGLSGRVREPISGVESPVQADGLPHNLGAVVRVAAVLIMAGFSVTGEQMPAPYVSPGAMHKLQIADPRMVRDTLSRGSKLIADYGSYQLIEVDRREFDRLTAGGSSAICRDEYNLVQFIGSNIDTSVEPSQPPVPGRSVQVIQFRGPVRPGWLQDVDATGVKVLSPIAYDAYFAIGTESALSAAAKAFGVQWSAPYAAAYKIDPMLTAMQGTSQVTIQLLQDDEWNPSTLALIEMLKSAGESRLSRALGYVNVLTTMNLHDLGQLASRPDVISIQPYSTPRRL